MVSTISARGGSSYRRLLDEAPEYNFTQGIIDDPVKFESSSMAVTVLVLVSVLFFLILFSVFSRRFFSGSQSAENPRRQSPGQPYRGNPGLSSAGGLDAIAVRALPRLSYSGEGKEQDGCAVCLSVFVEKEEVKVIPRCGHVFHPECIDSWLLSRGSCPLCRCTELFGLSSRRESKTVGDLESGVLPEASGSREGRGEAKTERFTIGRSDSWHEATNSRPAQMNRSSSF